MICKKKVLKISICIAIKSKGFFFSSNKDPVFLSDLLKIVVLPEEAP